MTKSQLLALIDSKIVQNTNKEITADIIKDILTETVEKSHNEGYPDNAAVTQIVSDFISSGDTIVIQSIVDILTNNGYQNSTEVGQAIETALAGKGYQNATQVSGAITSALANYAAKTSPTFEGEPKAPTAALGTNTTQIATTEFVKKAIDAASVGGAGGTVTSVGISTTTTGLSVSPSTPITGAGTLSVNVASGHNLVTDAEKQTWNNKGNGTITSVALSSTAGNGLSVTTTPVTSGVATLAVNVASGFSLLDSNAAQNIPGAKTFTTASPTVPSKNSVPLTTNTTIIATEAQVALNMVPTGGAVGQFLRQDKSWASIPTPSYTAVDGKPTSNLTPSFGTAFTISQVSQSASGQISFTDRTITLPTPTALNKGNIESALSLSGTGTRYMTVSNTGVIAAGWQVVIDSGTQTQHQNTIVGRNANAQIHTYGGFFQDSDIRLKNITGEIDIDNVIKNIKNLKKIYYMMKDSNSSESIGVVAQELQAVYPELVSEDKETGYLSVDYPKLSVIALSAIDAISNKMESFEERLSKLENK